MEAAGPGSVGRARSAKPPFIVRQLAREPAEQGGGGRGEGTNEVIDREEQRKKEKEEREREDEGRIRTEANVRPLLRP